MPGSQRAPSLCCAPRNGSYASARAGEYRERGALSFAELFLRIGCGLVGWLLIYAHALLLAVVPQADCSRALFSTTLLFAGFAIVAAGLLQASLAWRGPLRWLGLPVVPLWAIGVSVAWGLWETIAASAPPLCDVLAGRDVPAGDRPWWERLWVPAQLTTIGLCALSAARYWRPAAGDDTA